MNSGSSVEWTNQCRVNASLVDTIQKPKIVLYLDFACECLDFIKWKQNKAFSSQARPMTRYLPNRKEEFDLRAHVESSGHSIDTCPFVILTEKMCKGHLVKMGGKIKSWKKRWFVFDRLKRNFSYYIGEDTFHLMIWYDGTCE